MSRLFTKLASCYWAYLLIHKRLIKVVEISKVYLARSLECANEQRFQRHLW